MRGILSVPVRTCPQVRLLLREGANPDLEDKDGKTAVDLAKQNKHDKIVAHEVFWFELPLFGRCACWCGGAKSN